MQRSRFGDFGRSALIGVSPGFGIFVLIGSGSVQAYFSPIFKQFERNEAASWWPAILRISEANLKAHVWGP